MVFTAGPRWVHFFNMTWKGYRRICNFVCEHASRMSAPPRLQFFPFSLGWWMIFFRYGRLVLMPFCIRATWHVITPKLEYINNDNSMMCGQLNVL